MTAVRLRRHALTLGAAAGISALLITGCSSGGGGGETESATEASPGITDTTIKLGTTSPMSGNAAGVGTCVVNGAQAYFEMRNAEGGFEFGDGKTREVEFAVYDDGYDPQRSLANFDQMVSEDVFAAVLSLGTPTNRAWREAAIEEEVPQVLVQTGDPLFSNQEESPWQLGLLPVYPQEGEVFGEMLAESAEDHKVAVLYQNDDFGIGYVEGFKKAIEGADNIEIVKELSYETTDINVQAQITELAATDADIFFNAMSPLTSLVISAFQQADAVGWLPSMFLPSPSANPATLAQTEVAGNFPAIYTTASTLTAASPTFVEADDQAQVFLDALTEYTDQEGVPTFPQCLWSWIGASVLEEAFKGMTEPTRENFMESLRSIEGFKAPFLVADSTINTTDPMLPAMSGIIVQQYNGAGFTPVDSLP